MKVCVLEHVPFEGLGSISAWLDAHHAEIYTTRFYECFDLPSPKDIDLVIVMGGPMSVNDEEKYPWLRVEKKFISDVIASTVPIVGICLGAQLIASALGAKVYAGREKEIGYHPIYASQDASNTFNFPASLTVFHWHGETFDLPEGAVRLARSSACENQAFQIKTNVIGLQFHLESTKEIVNLMLENCRDELTGGPYVQTEKSIREEPSEVFIEMNLLVGRVLDYLCGNREP